MSHFYEYYGNKSSLSGQRRSDWGDITLFNRYGGDKPLWKKFSICYTLGQYYWLINNGLYFSKTFHKKKGASPKAYRIKIRGTE